MDSLFPCFIFLAVISLAAVSIVWAIYAERKRTEKMQQAAEQLTLPFYPTGDPALLARLSHFQLFTRGHSQKFKNLIHGATDEVVIGIFDYQFTTGGGKNSQTSKQTVICFEAADLQLPQFALQPETLFHKLGSLVGFKDFNFETHPNFSRLFHLQGSDEASVRRLFRDEVLTHFEGQAGVCLEGHERQLVFYRPKVRVAPEQVRSFLEEGFRVYSLLRSGR